MAEGAPTLFEVAQRACAQLHTGIESVGDIRWEVVRPIILKVDSAEQLVSLDLTSSTIDLTLRSV